MYGLVHTVAGWETPLYLAQQRTLRSLGIEVLPTSRNHVPGSDDHLLIPRTIPVVVGTTTAVATSLEHLVRAWRGWFRRPVRNWMLVLGGPNRAAPHSVERYPELGLTSATDLGALAREAACTPDLLSPSRVEAFRLPQLVHEIQWLVHELNAAGEPTPSLLAEVRDCVQRGRDDGFCGQSDLTPEEMDTATLKERLRTISERCKKREETR